MGVEYPSFTNFPHAVIREIFRVMPCTPFMSEDLRHVYLLFTFTLIFLYRGTRGSMLRSEIVMCPASFGHAPSPVPDSVLTLTGALLSSTLVFPPRRLSSPRLFFSSEWLQTLLAVNVALVYFMRLEPLIVSPSRRLEPLPTSSL